MIELSYNYALGASLSPAAAVPKIGFFDLVICRLTVFSHSRTLMDLSAVASWRGAVATSENRVVVARMAEFGVADAAGGVLLFSINCATQQFLAQVRHDQDGLLELYGCDAGARQIVRIRIPVSLNPVIDPPANVRPLNELSSGGVSVNGLSGTVTLVDGDGMPFATDGQNIIIPGDSGASLPVSHCTDIRCVTQNRVVRIKWRDSGDLTVDGVALAKWDHTVLVRKKGGFPQSVNDGTVIISSSVLNQYDQLPLIDMLPSGDVFYYRLFPVAASGAVNTDLSNQFQTNSMTWNTVADIVRSGGAKQYFAAGDVLTTQHAAYGEIFWQVAGFDQDTPSDQSKTHSMRLLSVYALPSLRVYDAPENLYALTADKVFVTDRKLSVSLGHTLITLPEDAGKNGLNRAWYNQNGTTALFFNPSMSRWEYWNCTASAHVPTSIVTYQTTPSADPTGGAWLNAVTFADVNKYYTRNGSIYTEASVTKGAPVPANTYYERNPSDQRPAGGNNSWRDSSLRQWLNSAAPAGAWWSPRSIFDTVPDDLYTVPGFMAGFTDPEFLSALGAADIVSANSTRSGGGGSYVTADKVFAASYTEVLGELNGGVQEGALMELYVGASTSDRIKKTAGGAAVYWWLRSCQTGSDNSGRWIGVTGGWGGVAVSSGQNIVPSAVIC